MRHKFDLLTGISSCGRLGCEAISNSSCFILREEPVCALAGELFRRESSPSVGFNFGRGLDL